MAIFASQLTLLFPYFYVNVLFLILGIIAKYVFGIEVALGYTLVLNKVC